MVYLLDSYSVGGLIREFNGDAGRWFNIFLDLTFTSTGYVTKWRYFAKRPGEFVATVWRPLGNNRYELIARDYVFAGSVGIGVSTFECIQKIPQ